MNIALIQAGGVGKRTLQEVPKQFLNIQDKPIILYTLEPFQNHPNIDGIVVVCLDGWHDVLRAYCRQYNVSKLESIVTGGSTGIESILNGLSDIRQRHGSDTLVMIHEAVRPMISAEIISDSLRVATLYGSAVAALPCVDEVVGSTDSKLSDELVPRDGHFSIQNPHTFTLEKLEWAYNEATKRSIPQSLGTAVLMSDLGERLYLSAGSAKNFKITMPEDIEIVRALLSADKVKHS